MHTLNADLHCHSVVSDGTLSPVALANRAFKNGVQIWSLTDHDEVGGQVAAKKAALDLGMQYITGVEISVTWCGRTIHVVGLGFDEQNSALVKGLYDTRNGRVKRAQEISLQLDKVGIKDAYDGALALVESGVCKNTDEVFSNYLIEGKPGFVPHEWANLDDALTWIAAAGGIAVIAHPGRYSYSPLQFEELYAQFKDLGGRGIEVITGSHTPSEYQIFAKVAQQYGFLASRGSDFHDPVESHTDLGLLPNLPSQLRPVWSVFQ
jgi:3',5'-nucleoside bisphosphate phosphatase